MAFVLVQGSCGVRFEAGIQELTKPVLAGPIGEVEVTTSVPADANCTRGRPEY